MLEYMNILCPRYQLIFYFEKHIFIFSSIMRISIRSLIMSIRGSLYTIYPNSASTHQNLSVTIIFPFLAQLIMIQERNTSEHGLYCTVTYFKLHGLVYIPFPSESIEADRHLPMIFTILSQID